MKECEIMIKSLHLPDLDMKVKIQNSIDILGYVNVVTGKAEDRRRLLITDCMPLTDKKTGSVWSYRLSTRSLGSGKTSRVSVSSERYNQTPIKVGNIVYAKQVGQNRSGYWYIYDYEIE